MSEFSNFLRAKELTQRIWDITLQGIEDGELDAPATAKEAFFAGAMSAFALVDASMDDMAEAQKKAKLN